MKYIFWILFLSATVVGLALPFLPPGAWPWWDSTWVALFFIPVYVDLSRDAGLSAARFTSGIVVVSMAVLLGISGLTGWPVGPLRFTAHAGLQLGGAIPLVFPLLAFSLLTVSWHAAAWAFPSASRTTLALATAAGFLLSIINGIAFFVTDRIWWEWNPMHDPNAAIRAAFGLAFLGATAFALAFVFPVDTRLRLNRWSTGLAAWLAANALFLAANFAMFLK